MSHQEQDPEQPVEPGALPFRRRTPSEILEHIAEDLRPLSANLPDHGAIRLHQCITSLRFLAGELEKEGR